MPSGRVYRVTDDRKHAGLPADSDSRRNGWLKMHENLLTVACFYESIAFVIIKPFYCTNTEHKLHLL